MKKKTHVSVLNHYMLWSISVTLHWNPFWLYCNTVVMFVFLLFFHPLLSPSSLAPWINFPLCWMAGTCSVDFRCTGGRFIAPSVFVCGGIPRFYSAHERTPSGQTHSSILCFSTISANGPGKHDLLPSHTGGTTTNTVYITNHHLHTWYLLLSPVTECD